MFTFFMKITVEERGETKTDGTKSTEEQFQGGQIPELDDITSSQLPNANFYLKKNLESRSQMFFKPKKD